SHRRPTDLRSFPTRRSSDLCNEVKVGAVGLLALAFLCAAHAAVHTSHIACLLGQWTLGHALHLSLGGVHGLNSANNTVDLVFVVDRKSTRLNSSHVSISYAV